LKLHFSVIDNIVAIGFLAVIPRYFARINERGIEGLWIPIDCFVKSPVELARTLPEFD